MPVRCWRVWSRSSGTIQPRLCRGECSPDCVDFRGRIRTRQREAFGAEVSVVLSRRPDDPDTFGEMLARFGCGTHFGTIEELPVVRLAPGKALPALPEDGREWILQPAPPDLIRMEGLPEGYAGFAYAPLEAARAGIQPFYGVLYKGRCRDWVTDIFVEDGVTGLRGFHSPVLGYLDRLLPEGKVVLGEGHAQLREILSAMRMRGFAGRYHLMVPEGNLYAETLRLLKEFWNLLP